MVRNAHKLLGNKTTKIPKEFITYDTETYAIDNEDGTKSHYLKLGIANYYKFTDNEPIKDNIKFYDCSTFWNWVISKMKTHGTLYLFAHNAQFDSAISKMFLELPKRGWDLERNIIDSSMFIVRWANGEFYFDVKEQRFKVKRDTAKYLYCLDTMNYFKSSLKEIGLKLGFEKLEIDIEQSIKTKEVSEELITYCQRDVDITEKLILEWFKFLKNNDLGNFQPTIASQAFNSFRHKFMEHPIYIHINDRAIEIERESYKGGRNECFFIGKIPEKIYVYDFNSLYPSVMIDNFYPTNLCAFRLQNDIDSLTEALKNKLVIAELKINIKKPYVAHRKERLLFPIGRFTGYFCSPEIELLLERNCIEEVGKVCYYDKNKIFSSYVKFFYEERLKAKANGDKVNDEMLKIMLNSLYGKFGQKLRINEIIGDTDFNDISVKTMITPEGMYNAKSFGGKVFKCSTTKEESSESFPAIASFCTAYARMKLLYAIEQAGWENVYYVDTDSLFVNETGKSKLNNLIDNKKLGYLKLEYEAPHGMIIKGCKDYVIFKKNGQYMEKIEKIKGVPKKAMKNDENVYELTKFDKFATSVRNGNLDRIVQRQMIKNLSREYTKGKVLKNGNVLPIRFNE